MPTNQTTTERTATWRTKARAILLQHIANKVGTPTYVYDLGIISEQVSKLRQALPASAIRYAVKANPCGALLRHMAAQGLGAEVITLGELERALAASIAPENILVGGPGQSAELMQRAVEVGVGLVSLDSLSQWELWQELLPGEGVSELRFVLRLNPALDPKTHEHLATGAAESKFGMTLAEVEQLAAEVEAAGRLAGFHVHAGSQISEMAVYDEIFSLLGPLYERFSASLLDIGGGFAVPGFPLEDFAAKARAFTERFNLELVLEPGRYLVAPAGILLTRVLHVKEGALKHVIADAGMADLLRPALYGAAHPIRALAKNSASQSENQTVEVDGPLCENADRLGRFVNLPALERGDLLVVEQAGAYGFAMASNYASNLRPAEVIIDGEAFQLVRRRETVDDLLRLELEVCRE